MKAIVPLIFLLLISCKKSVSEKVIGIQPYGQFSKDKTIEVAGIIAKYYKVKVVILPEKEISKSAFVNEKSPRFRADSIIKFQQNEIPTQVDYIIGLTADDISTTKKNPNGKTKFPPSKYQDWGVMGLGYCPGKSCVVSDFRLKNKNIVLSNLRLKKVALHEIGHNFGLPHCPDKKCLMTDAVESIATIDNANLGLCENCKKKLANQFSL